VSVAPLHVQLARAPGQGVFGVCEVASRRRLPGTARCGV